MLRLAASGEGGEAVDLEQAVDRHDAAARGGRHELVAHGRSIPEIAEELGADYVVYQEVADLKAAILEGSDVDDLDMSCFDGRYVTGTVTEEYLDWVESSQES